jgi:hypothetical protein
MRKCLSNSYLQPLEDKDERVLLQWNSTRGCQGAGEVHKGGLVKFQLILN